MTGVEDKEGHVVTFKTCISLLTQTLKPFFCMGHIINISHMTGCRCRDTRAKEKTTKFIISYENILIMLHCDAVFLSNVRTFIRIMLSWIVNGELVKWFISEKWMLIWCTSSVEQARRDCFRKDVILTLPCAWVEDAMNHDHHERH